MTRTYGKVEHGIVPMYNEHRKVWGLTVEPHVAIKVKRTFPRAYQGRTEMIVLDDTPDVARDLEWFLLRYPLDISEKAAAHLLARADEDRDREDTLLRILDGSYQHTITGWVEPSREPRPYQTSGADAAWTMKGMLLGDDVGLGKTQTGLMLLRDPDTRPALVVCMTHLPPQWVREIEAVFPMFRVYRAKTTNPEKEPGAFDADVVVMNYHKLPGWRDHLTGVVRTVIFDEVQELRRSGTLRYDAAAAIAEKAEWRLGLSATPIYNYGGETHTIFNVLAPGALGTRSEFVREWGGAEYGGDNIKIAQPKALGTFLRERGLLVRRTRKQVKREIGEPIKILQEVPANTEALDKIKGDLKALARLLVSANTEEKTRWRAAGQLDLKMRQATGIAKAPYVAEFTRLLLESEEKVVLYGWHRMVYEIWHQSLRDMRPLMYTGSETVRQKDLMAQAFIEDPARRVMFMSLRSGAGLDGLQKACSTTVFGELDWSPAMHDQAIGRLNRDGQESAVAAYFCVTGSGSDPVMAERLNIKVGQAVPITNPDADAAMFGSNLGRTDISKTRALLEAVERL